MIEKRVIELEWPARLRLGESDVLRLALVPSEDGYTARAEFQEHPLATQDIQLKHPAGYSLYGIARLHGVGFEIAPSGDQRRLIPPQEAVSWRWSIAARQAGQQRLSVELALRWEPDPSSPGPVGESLAFGRSLDVNVVSFMGLTQFQALGLGLLSLLLGGGLGVAALLGRRPQLAGSLQAAAPNRELRIEYAPSIRLADEECRLVQALFARYNRLILENEFFSGYSGARTFLARPLYADGRADAATIVKIGGRRAVLQEFHNYEAYVKDRLPPVTARIHARPGHPGARPAGGAAVYLHRRAGPSAAQPAPGPAGTSRSGSPAPPVRDFRPPLVAAAPAVHLPPGAGIRPPAAAPLGIGAGRGRQSPPDDRRRSARCVPKRRNRAAGRFCPTRAAPRRRFLVAQLPPSARRDPAAPALAVSPAAQTRRAGCSDRQPHGPAARLDPRFRSLWLARPARAARLLAEHHPARGALDHPRRFKSGEYPGRAGRAGVVDRLRPDA